ncbi:MAG: CIA30 family protein [Methylococcales bacterium]
MLIDFTDVEACHQWLVINDYVMGGISQSRIERSLDATGLFRGSISLEYNGGFASIRRRVDNAEFIGAVGMMLRVKGDGRTYQFRVKTDELYDGVAYRACFATDIQQWQIITLPFDSFSASFRGRAVPEAPALRPEHIRQLGFMLADKKAGIFCLEIDWIKPF